MAAFTHKFWSISLAIVFAGALNWCACMSQCAAMSVAKSSPSMAKTSPGGMSSDHSCCKSDQSESPATPHKHTSDTSCPKCGAMNPDRASSVSADAVNVSIQFLSVLPPLPYIFVTGAVQPCPSTSYAGDSPPGLVLRDLVHTGCQLTV